MREVRRVTLSGTGQTKTGQIQMRSKNVDCLMRRTSGAGTAQVTVRGGFSKTGTSNNETVQVANEAVTTDALANVANFDAPYSYLNVTAVFTGTATVEVTFVGTDG